MEPPELPREVGESGLYGVLLSILLCGISVGYGVVLLCIQIQTAILSSLPINLRH